MLGDNRFEGQILPPQRAKRPQGTGARAAHCGERAGVTRWVSRWSMTFEGTLCNQPPGVPPRGIAILRMGGYHRSAGVPPLSTVINPQAPHLPPGTQTAEEERRELETFAASLANAHRLQRLITYIGDKYFQGETDQLHEYEIATEVFGRSKATFNPGDDAIVRVEAHRLRKRLKEYYDNGGKDHRIQLSIPPGSYVPVFTRRTPNAEDATSELAPPRPKLRSWLYPAIAAALVLLAVTAYIGIPRRTANPARAATTTAFVPSASLPAGVVYAKVPLRIRAGYTGSPQIDNEGAVWQPDEYFQAGGAWARPQNVILRTNKPMLYEHWRNGDFSYSIPLAPGDYELHLYFASIDPDPSGPESFLVLVNGTPLLKDFDINSDALGLDIADERVFRDISPASDGLLHIGFESEASKATLNAIEILPGTRGKLLPIRIVTQPVSFTDHSGQFWHTDDYYLGGYTSEKRLPVAGTPDVGLYSGERYGHFSYAIPVDPRDQYTLVLHFAELYFGPQASGAGGVGSRLFRVSCNGETLLHDFDIYKQAGELHALTETFHHLKPTAQGKLNLTFDPIANNATVSAIEVIDEGQ